MNKHSINNNIKELISNHQIISFDIFDTLILRPFVEPTDLFKYIEVVYDIKGFASERITAEKKARQNKKTEDVTLIEIYSYIKKQYKSYMKVEMDCELNFTMANSEMKKIYDYAVSENKEIIIISDMYLSQNFLKKILEKNGYANYKNIYISSKIGKTKLSGNLYKYVLEDIKCKASEILHIGDNIKSDINSAKNLELNTFYYQKVIEQYFNKNQKAKLFWDNNKNLTTSIMLMLMAIKEQQGYTNYWKRIGYEYGGPVCFSFINWLYKETKKEKINQVLFVARDGYTLQKIYELFSNHIKNKYIYAPRIFNTLGLLEYKNSDVAQVDTILKRYHSYYPEDASVENIKTLSEKNSFILEHKQEIKKVSNNFFNEYVQYIKSQKVKENNIAIIDSITTKLSSQRLISKALNQKVMGFYWTYTNQAVEIANQQKEKIIAYYPGFEFGKDLIYWDFMELLMTSPEPPIEAIINNKIQYKKSISNEEKYRNKIYPDISEGSISFAEDILKIFKYLPNFEAKTVMQWLNILANYPEEQDIINFTEVKHAFDSNHSKYYPIFKHWYTSKKVSVIIPVYNVENYLKECLDSVINQTLKDIEIICIDDGSTDKSLDILKEYAKKDTRFIVLTQENKGAAIARNKGLDIARGEYVIFLDSDDFFEKNFLEEMYNCAKQKELDVCICNLYYYDDVSKSDKKMSWALKKAYIPQKEVFNYKDCPDYIFNFTNNWAWNKIFKKEFLKKNHIKFQNVQHTNDTYFTCSALLLAQKISVLDKHFIHYRTNRPASLTSQNIRELYPLEIIKVIDSIYSEIIQAKAWNSVKKSFLNLILEQITFNLSKLSIIKAEILKTEIKKHLLKMGYANIKLEDIYEPIIWKRWTMYMETFNMIPIILSSDNNYAPYMYVTMFSMLENADKSTFYDYYLLVPSAFSSKNTKLINQLKEKYNCDIHFIDMKNAFSDLKMQISHITSPTYYRLLAANILPQKYEKCIYLDVDVCVCKDLSELYNIDLKDDYVAGVIAPIYLTNKKKHCERLNLPNIDNYINAGVLLLNLKKIRQDNLTTKFVAFSNKNYESQDQDVINVVCFNYIKRLELKYNFMTKYEKNNVWETLIKEKILTNQEVNDAHKKFVIIHYADVVKPWHTVNTVFDKVWWSYAWKTPYFKKRNYFVSIMKIPYNLYSNLFIRKKYQRLISKLIMTQLKSLRIDIKNLGKENNAVELTSSAKVYQPTWFTNAYGQGQVVESNKNHQDITIKVIQDGKLRFDFRGQDKRFEGTRFPVWIDYKSIKINGKEILLGSIATWHDKPFNYEMPVKDGQVVKVEVVQQYHKYSKDELKDVILKLNPNSDYIKEHVNKLTDKIYKIIANEDSKKSLLQRVFSIFSCTHKNILDLDLIQKNQLQIMNMLQEMKTQNISLEKKNDQLQEQLDRILIHLSK